MVTRTTITIDNGTRGTRARRTGETRFRLSRDLERLGGAAGLLVPATLAVAVYSTAVNGPNLRQGAFPWAASTTCILVSLVTGALARRHHRTWGRWRRAVVNATTWALVVVAAFFIALGAEDLLHQGLGTPRLLSESGLIAGLGTLVASLLAIVVVPAGLLLTGAFTADAKVLSRPARTATLAVGPVLLLGALLTGMTDALWISVTWPLLLGGCWAVVGIDLLTKRSDR